MARTVNQQEYATKRRAILATAQRLIAEKGYARMTLQDILSELGMSSGAFYHYFPTKPALLEALAAGVFDQWEELVAPIVNNPNLTALTKLERFFATLATWKTARQPFLQALLEVWYHDENAVVRQKIDVQRIVRLVPLLTTIIRQGVDEGTFHTTYPEQAGDVILSLIHGLQDAGARLLLTASGEQDEHALISRMLAVHGAYLEAIERTLGLPAGSVAQVDALVREAVQAWKLSASQSGAAAS